MPDGGGGREQRVDGGARLRRRAQGERVRQRRQQRIERFAPDVSGQRGEQELPPREDSVAARVKEVTEEHVERRIAEVTDSLSSTRTQVLINILLLLQAFKEGCHDHKRRSGRKYGRVGSGAVAERNSEPIAEQELRAKELFSGQAVQQQEEQERLFAERRQRQPQWKQARDRNLLRAVPSRRRSPA